MAKFFGIVLFVSLIACNSVLAANYGTCNLRSPLSVGYNRRPATQLINGSPSWSTSPPFVKSGCWLFTAPRRAVYSFTSFNYPTRVYNFNDYNYITIPTSTVISGPNGVNATSAEESPSILLRAGQSIWVSTGVMDTYEQLSQYVNTFAVSVVEFAQNDCITRPPPYPPYPQTLCSAVPSYNATEAALRLGTNTVTDSTCVGPYTLTQPYWIGYKPITKLFTSKATASYTFSTAGSAPGSATIIALWPNNTIRAEGTNYIKLYLRTWERVAFVISPYGDTASAFTTVPPCGRLQLTVAYDQGPCVPFFPALPVGYHSLGSTCDLPRLSTSISICNIRSQYIGRWSFIAPAAGRYSFNTLRSAIPLILEVRDQSTCSRLACNRNNVLALEQAVVSLTLQKGQKLVISIGGNGPACGDASLQIVQYCLTAGCAPILPFNPYSLALGRNVFGTPYGLPGLDFLSDPTWRPCSTGVAPANRYFVLKFKAPSAGTYEVDTLSELNADANTLLVAVRAPRVGSSCGVITCNDNVGPSRTQLKSLVTLDMATSETVTLYVQYTNNATTAVSQYGAPVINVARVQRCNTSTACPRGYSCVQNSCLRDECRTDADCNVGQDRVGYQCAYKRLVCVCPSGCL